MFMLMCFWLVSLASSTPLYISVGLGLARRLATLTAGVTGVGVSVADVEGATALLDLP